jgi:hypothetical protein
VSGFMHVVNRLVRAQGLEDQRRARRAKVKHTLRAEEPRTP